jgi:FkbM family methyltransferase
MNPGKQFIGIAKPVVERFPKAAAAYRYMRDIRQILQEPKETSMGFKFIGDRSMEQGIFEPEETKIAAKLFPQVDVFINVGANIGYYCCQALRYGKHTVAFEPIEFNLRYLYKNIKANHWEKMIEVFPIALSDKISIIEIFGGGTGASLVKGWAGTSEQYVTLVPTSTMDNILGSRFQDKRCFLLVDIEGAEKYMLAGAAKMLAREPRPIWMVEISISEHQPKGVKGISGCSAEGKKAGHCATPNSRCRRCERTVDTRMSRSFS